MHGTNMKIDDCIFCIRQVLREKNWNIVGYL